jgi:kumamolisin
VIVVLRRGAGPALHAAADRMATDAAAAPLTRQEFVEQFGTAPDDFAKVARFARRHSLTVQRKDTAAGTVLLSGTAVQFSAAFHVTLQRYGRGAETHRGCDGPLRIPAGLQGVVTAVLGLDDRPQARAYFRFRPPFHVAPQAQQQGFLPQEVGALYDFPAGSGAGQCVALIELGGGYGAADARQYFSDLGVPMPSVTVVSADGSPHAPTGDPNGPDGEVMLDVEIAGALAPGAHLVLYFGANTDAGFLQALNAAVHDDVNRPSVISISWGAPEATWTPQALRTFDDALGAAAVMGITVCAAAGDSGASGGQAGGDHVDFPASSPHALACGGTRLQAKDGAVARETVWNDGAEGGASGGGVSTFFPLPAWQKALTVRTPQGVSALARRGVPDVAGNADPATGYRVLVDGAASIVGGTSAVAPLWAGLLARINASRPQPVGTINARLYAHPSAFRDITQGNNGGFLATPGWDACTGLGSPKGRALAALFPGSAA